MFSQMKETRRRRPSLEGFHLVDISPVSKSTEKEGRFVVSGGGEEGERGGPCLTGTGCPFGVMIFQGGWNQVVVMVAQHWTY